MEPVTNHIIGTKFFCESLDGSVIDSYEFSGKEPNVVIRIRGKQSPAAVRLTPDKLRLFASELLNIANLMDTKHGRRPRDLSSARSD